MHHYDMHVGRDGSYWALPLPENTLEHADRAREAIHGSALLWCSLVLIGFAFWLMQCTRGE